MNYGDEDAKIGRAILSQGYSLQNIYDVGGSNGSWVNIMSKVFKDSRFDLFEPLAEVNADYIDILVHLKAIHKESYMHPIAIGDKDGTIKINMFDDPSASTTLPTGLLSGTKSVKAKLRSIDSIVESNLCPAPDLIKMDIQGGELAALKGATKTLPKVGFLMLETWIQRSYGKKTPLLYELIEFLTPFGFVPYDFGDTFRNETGEAVAIDVWFINRKFSKNPAMF